MTATTGKINVVATRGMELTCAGCRQRFRSREISLADDASSRAWCQECVRGVASPAEVAALEAVNAFDGAVWDAGLLARNRRDRDCCVNLISSAVLSIERRLGAS
jgi:hypothetical protein